MVGRLLPLGEEPVEDNPPGQPISQGGNQIQGSTPASVLVGSQQAQGAVMPDKDPFGYYCQKMGIPRPNGDPARPGPSERQDRKRQKEFANRAGRLLQGPGGARQRDQAPSRSPDQSDLKSPAKGSAKRPASDKGQADTDRRLPRKTLADSTRLRLETEQKDRERLPYLRDVVELRESVLKALCSKDPDRESPTLLETRLYVAQILLHVREVFRLMRGLSFARNWGERMDFHAACIQSAVAKLDAPGQTGCSLVNRTQLLVAKTSGYELKYHQDVEALISTAKAIPRTDQLESWAALECMFPNKVLGLRVLAQSATYPVPVITEAEHDQDKDQTTTGAAPANKLDSDSVITDTSTDAKTSSGKGPAKTTSDSTTQQSTSTDDKGFRIPLNMYDYQDCEID